jgi:radical SAM protein with 4Fe4S-binding SPASM domain
MSKAKEEQYVYYPQRANIRSLLSELLPLRMPLSLNIEPTNLCNFCCIHCVQSFSDYKNQAGYNGNMAMDLYEKIINDIKAMGKLKCLRLFDEGEPLLNKNLSKMIKLASDADIAERIEIFTNATLLTKSLSTELINSGLTHLKISIYSVNQGKNAQITQTDYKVTNIYNNIRNFRKIRDELNKKEPFLYIKTIDSLDSNETKAFMDTYKDIADEIAVEPLTNWNGYEGREVSKNSCEDSCIGWNFAVIDKKEVCPYPFFTLAIKSSGDVVLCCVDWNNATKVGNLREQSLSEIWFGEKLKNMRKMHLERRKFENKSCKNCFMMDTLPDTDNIDCIPPGRFEEILNYKGC